MSVCFVVVPVVAGSWPLISAAILAAGAALGYSATRQAEGALDQTYQINPVTRSVSMTMSDSEVVTDTLMRGESFMLTRGDIQATFKVDGRGQCGVHVAGEGYSDLELQAVGTELMDRVRQQFAYAKVMQELEERGFQVVQQEVEGDQSIRIRVTRG